MAVGPSPWFRGFPRNILKLKRELVEMQEWRDSYVVMEIGGQVSGALASAFQIRVSNHKCCTERLTWPLGFETERDSWLLSYSRTHKRAPEGA